MIQELQVRVLPQIASQYDVLRRWLCTEKGVDTERLTCVRVLKRSIDARQRQVYVNLTLRLFIGEKPTDDGYEPIVYHDVSDRPAVVVVGAGPGGLFAALRLIELGLRPIVVERGKDVHARKRDIAAISREQRVNGESNYCFGEGGAGAYSDGKLYTRSKKRGSVDRILRIFCQHGASTAILADAHPHIGTDRLPSVIEAMRGTILRCGGEVRFETRMTELIIKGGAVTGIMAGGEEIAGSVILATGHSARDVYRYLASARVRMEAKGIAVGVRLEHPAQLIDSIQYHSRQGRGRWLPAAEYSFVTQVSDRGVYSFCMCPGGYIIPAATGAEQIVVNGMSPSGRNGRWSNSGMVVETRPDDAALMLGRPSGEGDDPLIMLRFQEMLERECWEHGARTQHAPAQRMADFVEGKASDRLNASSYAPGLTVSPLHAWLPPFVTTRLAGAFRLWGQRSRGFLTNEATMIAIETRTSAPVRITRDPLSLQHIDIAGLFPCGEGAGYAGGIVSAAIDGERCAEMVKEYLDTTKLHL